MRGEEPERMNPWFRGFRASRRESMISDTSQGAIERVEQDKYKVGGIVEKISDNMVEITELPIRKWTQDFKEMLEELTTGSEKVPATVKVRVASLSYVHVMLMLSAVRTTKSITRTLRCTSRSICLTRT